MKERGFEHLSGNLPKLSLRKQAMHNALAIAALVAIVSLLITSRFVFAQDEAEAGNKVYMPIIANQGESACTAGWSYFAELPRQPDCKPRL